MTLLRVAVLLVFAAASSCGTGSKKCTPDNCATGCCDADGECQAGTLFDACGARGEECAACTLGTTCQVGLCVSFSATGGGFGTTGGGSGATGGGAGTGGGSTTGGGGGGATGGGFGWVGGGTASTGGGSAASGGGAGTTGGGTADAGTSSCISIAGSRQEQVCYAWRCARSSMSEGTWNGNAATCTAGDLDGTGRNNALQLLNIYRYIAQLPAVTLDSTRNQKAQACALMMDAANALSHTPDAGWPCYTAAGAEAAGKSNISTGSAVRSIDMYMSDYGTGNAATLGHRRWLLSNSLGPVGIGGTNDGSCHWVIGGSGAAAKSWMSWPPPGPVPVDAIAIPGLDSVDTTGWSVQSDSINLSGAQVTVTDSATDAGLNVTVTQLGQYYGSTYALRFNPQGWTSAAGHTYRVQVSNIATPISYDVQVVSCP